MRTVAILFMLALSFEASAEKVYQLKELRLNDFIMAATLQDCDAVFGPWTLMVINRQKDGVPWFERLCLYRIERRSIKPQAARAASSPAQRSAPER